MEKKPARKTKKERFAEDLKSAEDFKRLVEKVDQLSNQVASLEQQLQAQLNNSKSESFARKSKEAGQWALEKTKTLASSGARKTSCCVAWLYQKSQPIAKWVYEKIHACLRSSQKLVTTIVVIALAGGAFWAGQYFSSPQEPSNKNSSYSTSSNNTMLKSKQQPSSQQEITAKKQGSTSPEHSSQQHNRFPSYQKPKIIPKPKKKERTTSSPGELAVSPKLEKWLKQSHVDTKEAKLKAIRELRYFDHPMAGKRLVEMLSEPDLDIKWEVIRALGDLEYPGGEALLEIVQNASLDISIRREALISLGKARSTETLHAVVQILNDENAPVALRSGAAECLGLMEDVQAVGDLMGQLRSSVPEVQESVCNALGRFAYPRAVSGLLALVRKEQSPIFVRVAAVRALGNIREGAARHVRKLLDLAKKDIDPELLESIKESLAQLVTAVDHNLQKQIEELIQGRDHY